jgi:hypothetical protein
MSSGVEFEVDKQIAHDVTLKSTAERTEVKGFVGWLIRKHLVPDVLTAKYILIGIIVLNFIIAGIITLYAYSQ